MADAWQSSATPTPSPRARGRWIVAALILFVVASVVAFTQAPNPRLEGRGVVESLLYPIERNPGDRLTRVGMQLNDIATSADGKRVVAVGVGGVILTSGDGEQGWAETGNELWGVSLSDDGRRAIAVGDGGVILTSGDGGKSWAAQSSGTNYTLWGVSLSNDGQRAIAVGVGGVILTSNNAGQSWAPQTSGTTSQLMGVSLSGDGQRAVAIANSSEILTSSNGGQSWAAQTSGITNPLRGISLSDDGQRAVAVGAGGEILTSGDGGQSWASRTSGTTSLLASVSLSGDGQRAFAVGVGGAILTSSNGGQSWASRTSGTTSQLFGVSLSGDGQRAVAAGAGGVIVSSGDGGRNWKSLTSATNNVLWGVSLSGNGQSSVAVGEGGVIFSTRDGGQSRVMHSSGTTNILYGVSLSGDGQRAIAVGVGGVILTSSNGGQSWAAQTSGTTNGLLDVSLSGDGQRAVAVGDGGAILTSGNGGQSWASRTSGTTSQLFGVSLSGDGQRAVAVGAGGLILTSSNGGQSWASRTSGTIRSLLGVSLSGDGQRAIAVGEGGVILASSNGGQSWVSRTSGTTHHLLGVSLSGDGQRIVAVGAGGVILTSSNDGLSWLQQNSGTTYWLLGVSLTGDGQRAVALGQGGVVLLSSNGGQSWTRLTYKLKPNYARYPAPWYYLALLLCGAFLYRAFSGTTKPPQSGAAAMAASDSPTLSLDQDRLEFAPLARGISRFLRNANTDPPLTLAITGEWGSGKSSLMGLVCADLRANHWRPVWFNAWHHQNEEQLLAALLVAIREHGAPPLTSPAGWAFRLRLLLVRAMQRKIATLLIVTVASLIIAFFASHTAGSEWQGLAALLTPFMTGKAGSSELSALASILPILGFAAVIVIIGRTMKAFGVDPAVLLSSTMAKFRLKDASAQTSFRMRFAEQFRDVTQALAHPMVIVIDDLDRCKPETVLDVMEAVNFLTSSGKCFVIFGMATQRVQAALALSFKEIASELAELDHSVSDESGALDQPAREREQRRKFAREYLEKLINIEILVPDRTDLPPSQLLEARAAAARDPVAEWIAEAKRWALLVPLGAAVALGVWLSSLIGLPDVKVPDAKVPDAPTQSAAKGAPTPPKALPTPSAAPPGVLPAPSQPANSAPVIVPGDDSGISLLWLAGALAALLLAGAALMLRWYQRQKLIVQDTQAFSEAMRIWSPIATFTRNSPRSIKRFGNRIRYLAMLQQGEQLDEPPLAQQLISRFSTTLRTIWARLRRRSVAPEATPSPQPEQSESARALSEHRVVALGAMHTHFGDKWRPELEFRSSPELQPDYARGSDEVSKKLYEAVEAYRTITGATWPPSPEELDAFERSLKGVRLPGDGRTFDASPADPAASFGFAEDAPLPVENPYGAGTTKARPRARPKA